MKNVLPILKAFSGVFLLSIFFWNAHVKYKLNEVQSSLLSFWPHRWMLAHVGGSRHSWALAVMCMVQPFICEHAIQAGPRHELADLGLEWSHPEFLAQIDLWTLVSTQLSCAKTCSMFIQLLIGSTEGYIVFLINKTTANCFHLIRTQTMFAITSCNHNHMIHFKPCLQKMQVNLKVKPAWSLT